MAISSKLDSAFAAAGAKSHGGHLFKSSDLARFVPFVPVVNETDQFQFVGLCGTRVEMVETSNACVIADISAPPEDAGQ
jgi:hypothetical protein